MAGLMLLGVQKAVRVNLAMAHSELELVRARWLARAGVEQAMAVLSDDSHESDGAWDAWHSDSELFEKVELVGGTFSVVAPPDVWSDPGTVRYGLVDHCARLNVNTADAKQLKSLCQLSDWQVESILDWRDTDNNSRTGGAEALFYNRLRYPYKIRNGPLRTVSELALVRGIDPPVLTGEDANVNGVLDVNEDDLGASYPDDDGDGTLRSGLAGLTTVYSYERNRDADGRKRVNANKADKKTLVDRFDFTDELADAVVKYGASQSGKRSGSAGAKKQKFASLMDLLKVKAKKQAKKKNSKKGSDDKVSEITLKWLADHLDELTLTDDDRLAGRINVNTAPREVLLTLPKMTAGAAEAICRRQSAGEGPFSDVGELLTSKTLTEGQFKAVAERVTVRGTVFEIRSRGVTNWGICSEIVAVVDRGGQESSQDGGSLETSPMAILYWYQSE